MLFRVSLAILHVDEKNLLACKDMGALMEEIKRKLDDLKKICKWIKCLGQEFYYLFLGVKVSYRESSTELRMILSLRPTKKELIL